MIRDLAVGDIVKDSGMGPGTITGFSDRGFPQVNGVTCSWLIRDDGALFDPYGVSARHIGERAAKAAPAVDERVDLRVASNDPDYNQTEPTPVQPTLWREHDVT